MSFLASYLFPPWAQWRNLINILNILELGTTEDFTYSGLQNPSEEFRLLRLQISSDTKTVHYSMTTSAISQDQEFTALSYSWGPAEDETKTAQSEETHLLEISGRRLRILNNLHYALQEICSRAINCAKPDQDLVLYLWIDAICINQSSVEERNQQVNIMDAIYSRASTVLVWLGSDSLNTMPDICDMLRKFASMMEEFEKAASTESTGIFAPAALTRAQWDRYLSAVQLPQIGQPLWNTFLSFFRRRWFQRLWVLQEVSLASSIEMWCGSSTVSWPLISNCCNILRCGLENIILEGVEGRQTTEVIFYSRYAGGIDSIMEWCRTGYPPELSKGMYRLIAGTPEYHIRNIPAFMLALTYKYFATDPRDKIFAILGMLKRLSGSTEPFVRADYSQDTSEVYTEVTKCILTTTNSLGLLSLIPDSNSTSNLNMSCRGRDSKLPTWALNFERALVASLSVNGNSDFNVAGPKNPSSPDVYFSGPQLCLFGQKIAAIKAKSEPLGDVVNHKSDFEDGIQLVLNANPTYPFTQESRIEVLWRTMMVNTLGAHSSADWSHSFNNWWLGNLLFRAVSAYNQNIPLRSYIETIPKIEQLAQSDSLPGHEALVDSFEQMKKGSDIAINIMQKASLYALAMGDWAHPRRVFTTVEGYFGMGYQSMLEGDEVWVLARASVPFILRKVGAGKERRYTLVGECYIHGIMHGEHFRDTDPVWEEIFVE